MVDIDDIDRQLIHALQLDGRAPFNLIAEVLGVSDQTVARRYRRLRSADLLRVVAVPPAGYLAHGRWILRLRCTPGSSESVAEALARRPDTAWVQLASGGTEVQCITRAATPDEAEQLLLEKLPRTSRIVDVAAYSVLHVFYGSPSPIRLLDALTPEQVAALRPQREFAADPANIPHCGPDDRPLLDVLARDGRTALPDLAAATGWSPSTVRRRVEHLRSLGALHFYAEFDLRLVGLSHSTRLWMTVAPSGLDAAGRALAAHPEVVFAAATSGATNLSATVLCRDAHDLYRYLTDRVAALPGVTHVESTPVIRNLKRLGRVLH
ncbi:Lrp/AsnC family transcriptional regulator [Actinomadura rupiterrae]|uniref:Lrp/AsnC family transcriptional regulator n=1 Tax=Actinomadura rupiterrae TaxID=559627 RepID=UPI0020A4F460|nr:Lrp/AsnC family transcriptional regulator [Actinomadura rupiterrae]MCP2341971.1 DNA-binding Lrp family transcriptional regulator [Actinomadura rupiterrae]